MIAVGERTIEILVFLVAVPAVGGSALARWAGNRAKASEASPAVVRGVRTLVTVAWVTLVAYGITLAFGPLSFFSTLTFTAVAGIAATLALQTTLQNIVAGFLLQRRRFLRMYDQVEVGGITGTIVSLGLVTTVVKTEDGTLAFVSNSTLLSGPLVNRTATARLRGEY